MNLQFSLIYRDTSSGDSEGEYVMRTFDAPSFITKDRKIWDICFFSYPFIIETNVMVEEMPPKPDNDFDYYTKLQVFLKNRKDFNFTEILGFDLEGVYRTDDTWLDPNVFTNAFASELVGTETQKLWSHDQKKTFKKFELGKASEDKLMEINQEINAFYLRFAQSMMNIFGKVSYHRFNEFLQRLWSPYYVLLTFI